MRTFTKASSVEEKNFLNHFQTYEKDIRFVTISRETKEFERQVFFALKSDITSAFIAEDYDGEFLLVINADSLDTWKIERKISRELYHDLDTLIHRSRSDQSGVNHLLLVDTIFNG